ncbi:DUF397 domain-containing protein [Saccharopolyspora gloriosae]|uniref:DUF397 domain-containing protein n=1 Tax=Saccharopolyspora gloriosae TaxID=455344 RepID=UPI001FB8579F|nr:DUF397 domain-containing protein [Saccharopolyspora gloriosae]
MSDTDWKKSSRSAQASNCVETAKRGGFPAIRDSKDPAGPWLRLSDEVFGRFVQGVKLGEYTGR